MVALRRPPRALCTRVMEEIASCGIPGDEFRSRRPERRLVPALRNDARLTARWAGHRRRAAPRVGVCGCSRTPRVSVPGDRGSPGRLWRFRREGVLYIAPT